MPMTSLSPSRGNSSRHHVLEVSELVRMICSHLEKKDYTSLLYVSRSVYDCTLPIAWEDVELQLALRLIPDIQAKMHNDESGSKDNHPPSSLDTINMSRFDMHAAFVKTLRISDTHALEITELWSISSTDTTSSRPFRNLRYIIIGDCVETKHVNGISRLLHPDLLGLELSEFSPQDCFRNLREEHLWSDRDVCFELINQVSRISPNIQTLHAFPARIAQSDEDDCKPAYKNLFSLRNLRSLAFSGTKVHESLLQAIGQLPHLETLSFCTDFGEEWEYDKDQLSLSDASFLSLRRLCLHALDESTMARVCKAAPLFHHVTAVTIVFEDQCFDENMGDGTRSELAVTSLGQNSPHLAELMILPRGNNGYFVVSWSVLEAFKQMPLRVLNLGELMFDSEDNHEDEDESDEEEEIEERRNAATRNKLPVEWKDLLAAVPYLEELHIPRQDIQPQDLRLFASALPRLRLLEIAAVPLGEVKLGEYGSPIDHKMVLSSWSYFESEKGCTEDSIPDTDNAFNAARYIYDIWSNVTCQTHGLKWDSGDADPHEKAVAKLNEALYSLKSKK